MATSKRANQYPPGQLETYFAFLRGFLLELLGLLLLAQASAGARLQNDAKRGEKWAGAGDNQDKLKQQSGYNFGFTPFGMGSTAQKSGAMSFAPDPSAQYAPSVQEALNSFSQHPQGAASDEARLNIGAAREQGAANIGAASGRDVHHYHDVERVPPGLSQTAGKGRVGKLDTCKDCGTDFVVKTYNATRCKSCAGKAELSYRKAKARKKA